MPLARGIRKFNRHFTNHLMQLFAGKTNSNIALVKHVGRHNGRFYTTPVLVERSQGGFVFALTYGRDVDWYQNILHHEGCHLVWHGKEYSLINPSTISGTEGLSYYSGFKCFVLKTLKIRDFFTMESLNQTG